MPHSCVPLVLRRTKSFLLMAVVMFFVVGGHLVLIEALGQSFVFAPPYAAIPPQLANDAAITTLLRLLGDLFVIALQLALPVMVVMFLLDFVLGLLNRVAPQIQVFFLGISAKATVGILVLFLTFGFAFDEVLVGLFDRLGAWLRG